MKCKLNDIQLGHRATLGWLHQAHTTQLTTSIKSMNWCWNYEYLFWESMVWWKWCCRRPERRVKSVAKDIAINFISKEFSVWPIINVRIDDDKWSISCVLCAFVLSTSDPKCSIVRMLCAPLQTNFIPKMGRSFDRLVGRRKSSTVSYINEVKVDAENSKLWSESVSVNHIRSNTLPDWLYHILHIITSVGLVSMSICQMV